MLKVSTPSKFSDKLLSWFDHHGRKTLPWHRNRDPYQIWVSEIMLQQTQVKAVIPYFERFILAFPTVADLAAADSDTVMHNWAGLGYYARARNLHKAAIQIVTNHESNFPEKFDDVVALPGIGRSTAGAILAFCFGQRYPILDGNVKRVLTRIHGIEGYPGIRAVENQLWQLADTLTPAERVGDYTQAIMDLGATLCSRSRPNCQRCPFRGDCNAEQNNAQHLFPFRKPKAARKQKRVKMLVVQGESGQILLEKRPETGIWGGLWSLPESETTDDAASVVARRFGMQVKEIETLATLHHGFTHFDLEIHPELIAVSSSNLAIMDGDHHLWYDPYEPQTLGLPAIVSRLLDNLSPKNKLNVDSRPAS
ncbi:MAG: A/G-specific adenine glycosylase [Acidiferrobacterales bacterium]|nr:A/G-specific adenine glycosylase [Acidiferrobacterales bacterium]